MAKRIVLVAHCLLNVHSKVQGTVDYTPVSKTVIPWLMEQGVGVIQLPCPELGHGGLGRWGQAYSQYDNPFFRKHCEALVEPIVDQLEEYSRVGYALGPVLGIDGSPSCGIEVTYDGQWGGELESTADLEAKLRTLQAINHPGVFMEVLQQQCRERGFIMDWLGIDETDLAKSLARLKLSGMLLGRQFDTR